MSTTWFAIIGSQSASPDVVRPLPPQWHICNSEDEATRRIHGFARAAVVGIDERLIDPEPGVVEALAAERRARVAAELDALAELEAPRRSARDALNAWFNRRTA